MSSSEKLQDDFLHKLVTERTPVAIYLVNGIRLHGSITHFDRFGVLLQSVGLQLIYKQSISTILPQAHTDSAHAPVAPPAAHAVDESPAPAASSSEPRDPKPTTTRIVLKPRKRT